MQVVKRIIAILIVLPLAVMFFMPKKELYYFLEKKLYAQQIMISDERLQEGLLSLTIAHPVFSLDGVSLAKAEHITLWSLLFYTKADVEGMVVAEELPAEISIRTLTVTHTLLSPMKIVLSGESSIGALQGYIDLGTRILHLDIAKAEKNKSVSKYLKKGQKGWYYESKF